MYGDHMPLNVCVKFYNRVAIKARVYETHTVSLSKTIGKEFLRDIFRFYEEKLLSSSDYIDQM